MVDNDRMLLPLAVQPLVCLLVLLQAPSQTEPNRVMPAALQVQAVAAARRMGKQHINLAIIPVGFISCLGVDPHPQLRGRQCLQQPLTVMLKIVEHQSVLPVQLLDEFHERLDFAVVDCHRDFVLIINRAVAKLQQLSSQDAGSSRCDCVLIHLQKQVGLQLPIGFRCRCVKRHRNVVVDDIRQGEIVFSFHADADVTYPDWTYDNFDGHISFRKDCDRDLVEPLVVGTWGLCIGCGCEIPDGLYCDDCQYENGEQCDECGEYFDEDDLYTVHNASGEEIRVCESCRNEYYTYCDACGEYHHNDYVSYIDGQDVCDDCRDEYYEQCEDCDEWHHRDDMYCVHDSRGNEIWVCNDCIDNYILCEKCNEYYPRDEVFFAHKANGDEIYVCEDCMDDFKVCPHCGELVEICDDGTCPHCGAIVEDEEEA